MFVDRVEKTINSKLAFEQINETKSEKIKSLSLGYSFLIQFIGSKFPEKQEIRILFDTAARVQRPKNVPSYMDDYEYSGGFSKIVITVNYTEISWGDDYTPDRVQFGSGFDEYS